MPKIEELVSEELNERFQEGCNTEGFKEKIESCNHNTEKLTAIYDELKKLDVDRSFPFTEPDSLEEIKAQSDWKEDVEKPDIDFNKIYGAWLGRCIGCALGKPFECYPFNCGKDSTPGWKYIYDWCRLADAYPLKDYAPSKSRLQDSMDIRLENGSAQSYKENIKFMQSDDDIRFTVLNLMLLEENGKDFTTMDVAIKWLKTLPFYFVFTAENQAYRNAPVAIDTIENDDEKVEYIRMHNNPYREWVGARIRADAFGYAAAGRPALAAELAYRDALLSHSKNGIYGEMFTAALIAAAFTENDPYKLIETALCYIPKKSRLMSDIKQAVEIAAKAKDELELADELWKAFGKYSWVHTNNNTALSAAALIFSGGDFEKAITTTVMSSWDTDSNGATVGSIVGALNGEKNIPEKWKAPLHDTLYSELPGFHPIAISECAKRSYAVYKKF
jgi:ADP-ribosylglycohydrolase